MLTLYKSYGASDFELTGPPLPDEVWKKLKGIAVDLLKKRGQGFAASLLESSEFKPYPATNGFQDEFSVLYMSVPVEQYVNFDEHCRADNYRRSYALIARALTETWSFIRFIAVGIDERDTVCVVASPKPEITSEVVERALEDAQSLIATSGPVSAVDRVHTAVQGFLCVVCQRSDITADPESSVGTLFALIRQHHPAFKTDNPHDAHVLKAFRGVASILEALNPIRNRGSMAHPNESLLGEAEAMLAVNCGRTVLHYIDSKLRAAGQR